MWFSPKVVKRLFSAT